jgi:ABC-type Zn uptake system ZnuABC Zn-binding protein ZnuA
MREDRAFVLVLLLCGLFTAVFLGLTLSFLMGSHMDHEAHRVTRALSNGPNEDTSDSRPIQIVTGLQLTYSLASELTGGTRIHVVCLFPADTSMEAQHRYVVDHAPAVERIAEQSVAAITIRSAWPNDPLFPALRARNIRIIEIDACGPVEHDRRGVALIEVPRNTIEGKSCQNPSPYVWHSLGNASRMAEVLAEDLVRLAPDETATVRENLTRLKQEFFSLRSTYQGKFAELATLEAVALCSEFTYLTSEFQVDILDYELKPEIYWSKEDCGAFTRFLRENEVDVVIHKWTPVKPILDAIDTAGAHLVVMNTMNPPRSGASTLEPDGYFRTMEQNLGRLHEAFLRAHAHKP